LPRLNAGGVQARNDRKDEVASLLAMIMEWTVIASPPKAGVAIHSSVIARALRRRALAISYFRKKEAKPII